MRFEFYEDKQGFWRWRLRGANDRVVVDAVEGYASHTDARRAIENFHVALDIGAVVPVVEVGA